MIAKPFVQQGSASHTSERNQRSALTVIELLVVLAVIGVLIAFLMPATRTGREPARRTQCKNNLKQIGLALYSYHDTYHAFPPAYTVDADGKPLHSWRTLILPYSDQAPLYAKIDLSKPWDDPVNAEAYNTRTPNGYCCPSVPGLPTNSLSCLPTGSSSRSC